MAVPLWVNTTPLSILHHHHHHKPRCQLSNCTSTSTHTHTHIPKHTQVIYFLVSIISSAIYFRKLPQLDSTQLYTTFLAFSLITSASIITTLSHHFFISQLVLFSFSFLFLAFFLSFVSHSLYHHFSVCGDTSPPSFPLSFLRRCCYSSFLFFLLKQRDTEKL